jgi:hypothetical protein
MAVTIECGYKRPSNGPASFAAINPLCPEGFTSMTSALCLSAKETE